MLSVATAPVDARQRNVALAVVFGMTAACLALMPMASTVFPPNFAVLPFLLGIAVASDFITAYLLISQFLASRLIGAAILAGAYLIGGFGVLGYLVSFPGVLGFAFPPQTAAWMWVFWHFAFPAGVALALLFDRQKRYAREKDVARAWMNVVILASIAISVSVFVGVWLRGSALPNLLVGTTYIGGWRTLLLEGIVVVNLGALALAIVWTQGRTVLHTWLIVSLVAALLDAQISVAGSARFTLGWYVARSLVVVASTAVLYAYLRQMHVLFGKLSDLSMIDGLTEIANRRYFEMRLASAVRHAHRTHRSLALVMIDVDTFKLYNDTYGHLAGDETLKSVASALRHAAKRPNDVVARWGGEEFVAVLPETDHEGAYLVADRLRAAVQGLAIPHRTSPVPAQVVTISVGVAMLGSKDDDGHKLVERADVALYRAKETGRNTVCVELPLIEPSAPEPDAAFQAIFETLEIEGA